MLAAMRFGLTPMAMAVTASAANNLAFYNTSSQAPAQSRTTSATDLGAQITLQSNELTQTESSCAADCAISMPRISAYSWVHKSGQITHTYATVMAAIDQYNSTSYSTKSAASGNFTFPTNTNSDGTVTTVLTNYDSALSQNVYQTLIYPEIALDYKTLVQWAGTLAMTVNGSSTCQTVPSDVSTSENLPSHPFLPIATGVVDTKDPQGWNYGLKSASYTTCNGQCSDLFPTFPLFISCRVDHPVDWQIRMPQDYIDGELYVAVTSTTNLIRPDPLTPAPIATPSPTVPAATSVNGDGAANANQVVEPPLPGSAVVSGGAPSFSPAPALQGPALQNPAPESPASAIPIPQHLASANSAPQSIYMAPVIAAGMSIQPPPAIDLEPQSVDGSEQNGPGPATGNENTPNAVGGTGPTQSSTGQTQGGALQNPSLQGAAEGPGNGEAFPMTLSPGGPPSMVDGTPITVPSQGNVIVVGAATHTLPDGSTSTLLIGSSALAAQMRSGEIVRSSLTDVAGSSPTISGEDPMPIPSLVDEAGKYVIEGQTLTPGEVTTLRDGKSISFASDRASALVDGHSVFLRGPQQTPPPQLTIGGETITASSGGSFVLEGKTLIPGGSALIKDGTIVSLASNGATAIINGQAQDVNPGSPAVTLGSNTIMADSDGDLVLPNGIILIKGGVATVDGTTVSLASNGAFAVVNGRTESLVASTSQPPSFGGVTPAGVITAPGITATPVSGDDYVINGQTLTPGGVITVGSETISLASDGSDAVINGVTETLGIASAVGAVTTSSAIATKAGAPGSDDVSESRGWTCQPSLAFIMLIFMFNLIGIV